VWHAKGLEVPHIRSRGLALLKALCWHVLKIGILTRSRLQKGMMVIWRLRERTIEHRTLKGRSLEIWSRSANGILGSFQGLTHESCWTDFLITTRHGEVLTRDGPKGVLGVIAKVLSPKNRRVVRVVDYEGMLVVWEGLKTAVSSRRQIGGIDDVDVDRKLMFEKGTKRVTGC
jgi:hypothetical protein